MKKISPILIAIMLIILCSCGNDKSVNSDNSNGFKEDVFSNFQENSKENEGSAGESNTTDKYGNTLYNEGKIADDVVIEFKDEENNLLLWNDDIESVSAVYNERSQYCIGIKMTEAGRDKFATATRENIGRTISIIVDGEVINAPTVNEEITGGEAIVSGLSSYEELMDLFKKLTGQ